MNKANAVRVSALPSMQGVDYDRRRAFDELGLLERVAALRQVARDYGLATAARVAGLREDVTRELVGPN